MLWDSSCSETLRENKVRFDAIATDIHLAQQIGFEFLGSEVNLPVYSK